MPPALKCSIIINTYNRSTCLARLLASLHHLTYNEFEVVVVNGPSTDETGLLLKQYAERIKIVDCPEANLSLSRNLGIAAAVGDIVVFIDDDALPAEPNWLDKIVEAFQADTEGKVGAVGGPALHCDTAHYQFRAGLTSDYAFQVFRATDANAQPADGVRWFRRTVGCNSAFRRSALVEVGGFDEHLIYYLDESDVCLRLARRGYDTLHLEDGAVRHYPAPSPVGAPFLRNRRIVARSDTYYCMKNGGDGLLKRLFKTLCFAPQKHFFRELIEAWRADRLSTRALLGFLWQWTRGVAQGLWIGLFAERRTRLKADAPPPFLRFVKNVPDRKLRVCLLSQSAPPDPKLAGVARYTYDLARGLHELGHEVHLIYRSQQPVRRDGLEFTLHGIPDHTHQEQRLLPELPVTNKNCAYALAVGRKLVELMQQDTVFDVVHASNWDLEGLALPLLRIYPYVLMLVSPLAQVIETEGWQLNADLRLGVALDRWQIEQADSVCCPSWGVLESYRSKMGIDFEHLPCVQRVQLGIVPSLQARYMAGSSSGVAGVGTASPARQHRLLFVGRLEYRKGAHVLLEVLPDLLEKHPDWRCDLVGNDQVPDGLGSTLKEQFLRRHAMAPWLERVQFHGTVADDQLQAFYQSCDIFVAPSLFESFGLVYLEAMQYAKPVVGCKVGGIPEIVSDGVDGLLVRPGDADELAAALHQLMSDAVLRQRLGQAAQRKVLDELNHLAMAQRLLACYYEVIARRGAACAQNRRYYASLVQDGQLDQQRVQATGDWRSAQAFPGQFFLRASIPGATLRFETPGGSELVLAALRHDWGGVLTVSADGQTLQHVDLFSLQYEPDYQGRVTLPGTPEQTLTVQISIHPERNPNSRASQVWLRHVFLAPRTPMFSVSGNRTGQIRQAKLSPEGTD